LCFDRAIPLKSLKSVISLLSFFLVLQFTQHTTGWDDVRQQGATLYANGNQPLEYWHISMRPSGSINASPVDMANAIGCCRMIRGNLDLRFLGQHHTEEDEC
jgi:hypothetical protein